jgi:hypothetical protein
VRLSVGVPVGERSEVFHLISAHEVVPNWHLHPTYVAMCGQQVATSSMSAEADCPDCLREAIRQNRRAGVDADGAVDLAPRIDPASAWAAAATAT